MYSLKLLPKVNYISYFSFINNNFILSNLISSLFYDNGGGGRATAPITTPLYPSLGQAYES